MSSRVCQHCGCSEIDTDPARGDAVCTGCGSVLEDTIIVSEIQFEDNSKGGVNVMGQYVSNEGNKGPSLIGGFHHGMARESRAVTLENGKKRINQLGDQLRLNQHCKDTAFNFYKMAVSMRLTRGRKTSHVIAACLYIVCRTEATSHMLLDFSDVLQINVYQLGRTYIQLAKELHINIPALDPCLYIQRFAHRLEFGEKTHEVAMTALRLVSRMKRDWMAQGRRPSGLCGAALLVAARIHDFSRTIKEIIRVVKIGEGTIRRRLNEFENTASSSLTVDEFQQIDLEQESDPPAFSESKRKAKLRQLEESGQLSAITEEIKELQQEIDRTIEEAVSKKNSRWSQLVREAEAPLALEDVDAEVEQEVVAAVVGAQEEALDQLISQTTESNNTLASVQASGSGIQRPTAAVLGITDSIEDCMKLTAAESKEVSESPGGGELEHDDINDEELDMYILTPEEVIRKSRVWYLANRDYLIEQKEKERKRKEEEEANKDKPKKKRTQRKRKADRQEAATAGEAIQQMLQEKRISNKINYEVLKDLNKINSEPRPRADVLAGGLLQATPLLLRGNKDSKPDRGQAGPALGVREETAGSSADVLVESGPVTYDEDVDEDLEEELDEDEPVSAARLMELQYGREEDD